MGQSSGYTEGYKREAVAQAQTSGNLSQTARELGISVKSLRRWRKTYGKQKAMESEAATSAEWAMRVAQLERKLAEREAQIDVLKKAISIVSQAERSDTA